MFLTYIDINILSIFTLKNFIQPTMRYIYIAFAALILASYTASAQDRALKFLGIPVDGYKSEMIARLQEKGYSYSIRNGKGILRGEFNGTDVKIHIVTNKNKVWRIYIEDENVMDDYQIKLRFNTLCEQFERNSRYTSLSDEQKIPMDEKISYEMGLNDKRYEAVYYQEPDDPDLMRYLDVLNSELEEVYSSNSYSLGVKLSPEKLAELLAPLSLYDAETFSKYDENFFSNLYSVGLDKQLPMMMGIVEDIMSIIRNRMVWFTINKSYGGYYISMYYDNGYNKASGEDL